MNKNVLMMGLVGVAATLLVVVAFFLGRGVGGDNTDAYLDTDTRSSGITDDVAFDSDGEYAEAGQDSSQAPAVLEPGAPPPTTQPSVQPAAPSRNVYINGRLLSETDLAALEQRYGVAAQEGSYWYDNRSGAFGNMGGPAIGVMYPGHDFGSLPANASNGNSDVYFNGRELTTEEAYMVAALFGYPAPTPGRYWMDASGNLGVEGYAAPLGNIYAAIAASGGGGGGDNIWSKGLYSGGNYYTGAGGQVTEGYVSVPGYGPVSHGF